MSKHHAAFDLKTLEGTFSALSSFLSESKKVEMGGRSIGVSTTSSSGTLVMILGATGSSVSVTLSSSVVVVGDGGGGGGCR